MFTQIKNKTMGTLHLYILEYVILSFQDAQTNIDLNVEHRKWRWLYLTND